MKRSLVRLGAAIVSMVAVSSALVLVDPAPVGAATKATITLKPNSSVEASFGGFPLGLSLPFDQLLGTPPADCADGGLQSPLCHVIPLRLDVTNEQLKKRKYALSFTLAWDPGDNVAIPAVGTLPVTQLKLGIWDDPIVEDDDTPKECPPDDPAANALLCTILGPVGGDPGGDEPWFDSFILNEQPINFGMAPTRNRYALVVANQYGINTRFTLKVSFVSSDDVIDLSIDNFTDLSAAPPAEAVAAGIDAPALPRFDAPDFGELADIGTDADLDALGLGGDERVNIDAGADIIRSRNTRDIRSPGDENTLLLLLWLIVLPVAASAGGAWWFVRRRSAIFQ